MEDRHELISFGNTIPLKLFLHRVGQVPRHWHQSLELLFILSGNVEIIVDDQCYQLTEDDVILINSNSIHQLHSEDCVIAALQVKLSMFDKNLINESNLLFDCNSSVHKDKSNFKKIKILLAKMVKLNSANNNIKEILNKSLAYELLYELICNFKSDKKAPDYFQTQKHRNRLTRIIDFINDNYKNPISLADVAELEFLSIPYLSKFFKEIMGVNFLTYLNSIRLSHAVNEMLATDQSIQSISEQNGFANPNAFVTLFRKEYGMLPSQYREKLGSGTTADRAGHKKSLINYFELTQSTYLNKLAEYIRIDEKTPNDSSSKISLVKTEPIDTTKTIRKLTHNFKTFTSVGRAKEIMYSEVQQMLIGLQKDIGFKYIKFHGIFSDDMMLYREDQTGKPVLNFVYIDKVFDFLLSIHLKPLVQLSFMPKALAKYPDNKLFYSEFIISEPNDMSKWNFLVTEFAKHLIARYGKHEVLSWPFCVWNEPDTSASLFGLDDDNAFYELYRNSYHSIKSIDEGFTFGGPSVVPLTEEGEIWYETFIHFCINNDCIPDFFNLHYYDADFSALDSSNWNIKHTDLARLNVDPNAFKKFINKLKGNSTRFGFDNKKIYLTEWNSTPSHRDLMSDTIFKSCYVVKNLLENYDQLDSFCFWVLTDFIEEHRTDEEVFHGGMGLITYNGIKKPVYYAFYLLSKLGNKLIAKGDGYFVTKNERGIQLFLYNYSHFSNIYASGEVFDMTFTNRYTHFVESSKKEFSIDLTALENKRYNINEYIINKDYGSCFDKWVQMGAQPFSSDEDIILLKSLSSPMQYKHSIQVTENKYNLVATLEQLEIRFIELILVE